MYSYTNLCLVCSTCNQHRISNIEEELIRFFCLQDFGAAEGGRLPRCNQQNKYIDGPLAGQCRLEDIVNPDSEFRAILDLALSKAKSGIDLEGTEGRDAVQIKPQRVSLKLRISKSHWQFHK